MRVKWWVLVTIAVAAPFGAQADIQPVKFSDYWDSAQVKGTPRLPAEFAVESQNDPVAAVLREPASIRAVDTYMRRGFESSSHVGGSGYVAAPARVGPAPTPHLTAAAAAPEMNSGFAVGGLTLLFGGVAILRGRSRSNV
jgi:hypothetical protein